MNRYTPTGLILCALLIAGCAGCAGPSTETAEPTRETRGLVKRVENEIAAEIIDKAIVDLAEQEPELATRLGLAKTHSRWNPANAGQIRKQTLEHYARLLRSSANVKALDESSRARYAHFISGVERLRSVRSMQRINPVSGPQVAMPLFLINAQPATTEEDFEDYIVRVGKFSSRVEDLILEDIDAESSHSRTSKAMIRAQCEALTRGAPFYDGAASVLLEDFVARLQYAEVPSPRRDTLRTQLSSALSSIAAGCGKIAAHLMNAPASDGRGSKHYRDTDLHRHALQRAEALRTEFAEAVKGLEQWKSRPERNEKEIQALLNRTSEAIFDADAIRHRIASIAPSVDLEVRAVENFRFDTAPPAHFLPASTGNGAGTMYINPGSVRDWQVEVLAYAYAIPGAHMVPVTRLSVALPVPHFTTGWALYASRLPFELDDSNANTPEPGQIWILLDAAVRAAADTGMHGERWRDERVFEYLLKMLPINETEASNLTEAIRATPGEHAAAFEGVEKFTALRARVEAELGDAFDLTGFHDAILEDGPVPLHVVERNVERWMQNQLR